MKSYNKRQPPPELRRWQTNSRPWEDFARDAASYEPVRVALLAEQYHLCCYCENDVEPTTCHIEHFQPRHGLQGDEGQTFAYANLACSCDGGTDGNRHCGHCKGSRYDPARFINPSAEDSGRLFLYTTDGKIGAAAMLHSTEQERVKYMIDLLNLNCPRLASMRRAHAKGLMSVIQGLLDDPAGLDELAHIYLTPDSNGQLQRFFSLSHQLLGGSTDAISGVPEE